MSALLAPTNGYPDDVWDAVRAMWMAGSSAHSIAQKDGMPSKQAICVRAKEEGWERVDGVDPVLEIIPFDGLSHEQQIVVTKMAKGLTQRRAAALAGVRPETVTEWKKQQHFLNAIEAATAVFVESQIGKVTSADDWQSGMAMLKHHPATRAEFGAPTHTLPAALNFNVLGQVQLGFPRAQELDTSEACATPSEPSSERFLADPST